MGKESSVITITVYDLKDLLDGKTVTVKRASSEIEVKLEEVEIDDVDALDALAEAAGLEADRIREEDEEQEIDEDDEEDEDAEFDDEDEDQDLDEDDDTDDDVTDEEL